jgi:ubiquitin C-terminal hydrolase
MKGSLFNSFATLIKKMWKNDELLISPSEFKSQIARFAPRFVNYAQQDAEGD